MADLSERIPKLIAVGGPTATGKTALSVLLAEKFNGEIIGADSMQVYRGLNVGTAKATAEEQRGIPHHLVDILEPDQTFSVANFVKSADAVAEDIAARGKLPIVAGGTGLYITSMVDGINFAKEEIDPTLRQAMQQRVEREGQKGKNALYEELMQIDPNYAKKVHPNNLPRVIRALELYHTTGRKMSDEQQRAKPLQPRYDALCLCLKCSDRTNLYRRIDARVDTMVENGLLREAELVYENKDRYRTAAQAIGYKEMFPYLEGTDTLENCVTKLKQATRNYAKRQLTWFKNKQNAVWLDVDMPDYAQRATDAVTKFIEC